MLSFPKNFKQEYIILTVVILLLSYMIYDVVLNSKEYYCGCGSHKIEGFCGNLFSENCKTGCPQGFTSYAIPGIQTRNKTMDINLKNIEIDNAFKAVA